MKRILIHGPCKLKGSVKVQGAKNAARNHLYVPLLANDIFTFHNIPNIGNTHKILKIIEIQGGKVTWEGKNTVIVDTRGITDSKKIPSDVFLYTSSGILAIPILASKYKKCEIEKDLKRNDYGGDRIGGRVLSQVIETLSKLGIKCKETKTAYIFKKTSDSPFNLKVPVKSFAVSVNSIFASLYKKGTSTIKNFTTEAEFYNFLDLVKKAGAKIQQEDNKLHVTGGSRIKGVEYTNMADRHDFITLLVAALVTNSQIEIQNIDYKKMRLDALEKVADQMGLNLEFSGNSCSVRSNLSELKPVTIHAGRYPEFQTEWQVLISPLLTQIEGKSRVVEKLFPNRMQHWKELEKMGAKYKFIKSEIIPEYPHTAKGKRPPNAVEVNGLAKLQGAKVKALDVRSGAALIIAGLAAQGKTEISDIDHIERGYENIVERLKNLGANIEITDQ